MSDAKKGCLAVALCILLLLVGSLTAAFFIVKYNGKCLGSFREYNPSSCPNTLWTCTDGDICFASDNFGETYGAAISDGKITCFAISFNALTQKFAIAALDDIYHADIEFWPTIFDGHASCTEDNCIITYYANK